MELRCPGLMVILPKFLTLCHDEWSMLAIMLETRVPTITLLL